MLNFISRWQTAESPANRKPSSKSLLTYTDIFTWKSDSSKGICIWVSINNETHSKFSSSRVETKILPCKTTNMNVMCLIQTQIIWHLSCMFFSINMNIFVHHIHYLPTPRQCIYLKHSMEDRNAFLMHGRYHGFTLRLQTMNNRYYIGLVIP